MVVIQSESDTAGKESTDGMTVLRTTTNGIVQGQIVTLNKGPGGEAGRGRLHPAGEMIIGNAIEIGNVIIAGSSCILLYLQRGGAILKQATC